MRIVIELKRDAYPQVVLNNLFKLTPLQNNYSANILALVNGEPTTLSLRKMLDVFIEFRVETIRRRTSFLLKKAAERDTKSAVNIVFHESSTALFAAKSKDLPNIISSLFTISFTHEKLSTDVEIVNNFLIPMSFDLLITLFKSLYNGS